MALDQKDESGREGDPSACSKIVLLGIKVYSVEGLEFLRITAEEFAKLISQPQFSSIYKVTKSENSPRHIHDLRRFEVLEGLSVVLKGRVTLQPRKLLDQLKWIERQLSDLARRRQIKLRLFAYEGVTLMTPDLTLPYPNWHLNPEDLIPSTELWGDYIHPILEQPLSELAKNFLDQFWGEYFAQGDVLLWGEKAINRDSVP